MPETLSLLQSNVSECQICRDRFAATATNHMPKPVVWFGEGARILIAGQAPGMRVHKSGKPFTDPSGDRLRDWMGIEEAEFYDRSKIAIVPMAFCFPGYDASGSDLPPPKLCAQTWHEKVLGALNQISLTILVGGYAHKWHLGHAASVSKTVASWLDHAPQVFPLPHPSWRNTGWLKRNPWFGNDLIPALRTRVREVLDA